MLDRVILDECRTLRIGCGIGNLVHQGNRNLVVPGLHQQADMNGPPLISEGLMDRNFLSPASKAPRATTLEPVPLTA